MEFCLKCIFSLSSNTLISAISRITTWRKRNRFYSLERLAIQLRTLKVFTVSNVQWRKWMCSLIHTHVVNIFVLHAAHTRYGSQTLVYMFNNMNYLVSLRTCIPSEWFVYMYAASIQTFEIAVWLLFLFQFFWRCFLAFIAGNSFSWNTSEFGIFSYFFFSFFFLHQSAHTQTPFCHIFLFLTAYFTAAVCLFGLHESIAHISFLSCCCVILVVLFILHILIQLQKYSKTSSINMHLIKGESDKKH